MVYWECYECWWTSRKEETVKVEPTSDMGPAIVTCPKCGSSDGHEVNK